MRLPVIPPPSPNTKRERITALLDAMAYGLLPEGGSKMPRELAEDLAELSAGITAVEDARTDAGMLAAYAGCLLRLAGADPACVDSAVGALAAAEVKRTGLAVLAERGAK